MSQVILNFTKLRSEQWMADIWESLMFLLVSDSDVNSLINFLLESKLILAHSKVNNLQSILLRAVLVTNVNKLLIRKCLNYFQTTRAMNYCRYNEWEVISDFFHSKLYFLAAWKVERLMAFWNYGLRAYRALLLPKKNLKGNWKKEFLRAKRARQFRMILEKCAVKGEPEVSKVKMIFDRFTVMWWLTGP